MKLIEENFSQGDVMNTIPVFFLVCNFFFFLMKCSENKRY